MESTAPQHTDVEGVDAGVGLTALLVAASRAIETRRDDSLAQDAYAEHFVRAAPACTHWPARIEEVPDGDDNPLWGGSPVTSACGRGCWTTSSSDRSVQAHAKWCCSARGWTPAPSA